MKTALYILRHPIDGFWQMKYEKTGRMAHGVILLALTVLAVIFNRQTRAFVFNNQYNVPLDLFKEISLALLPVLLFCIANWAVTTLLDGKGYFPGGVLFAGAADSVFSGDSGCVPFAVPE